jgi:hypothetical protein
MRNATTNIYNIFDFSAFFLKPLENVYVANKKKKIFNWNLCNTPSRAFTLSAELALIENPYQHLVMRIFKIRR